MSLRLHKISLPVHMFEDLMTCHSFVDHMGVAAYLFPVFSG